jgi:hypothetical protein
MFILGERKISHQIGIGMEYTMTYAGLLGTTNKYLRLAKADNRCSSTIQPCEFHRQNQRKERMKAM